MEMVEYCIICGSTEKYKIFSVQDWLMERMDKDYDIVRCAHCGLVFQSPRLSSSELDTHYQFNYEPYQVSNNFRNASFFRKILIEKGLNSKVRMATQTKPTGRLLDVGCSDGMFLYYLSKKKEWDGVGVEINSPIAKQAQMEFGLNIVIGTLEEANFADSLFDVVTMWDVLEHLSDPAGALKEIHRILKNEGNLAIRLPNIDSRDAKFFGKYWSGYDSPRHLYIFGPKTIRELLETHGFKIISITTTTGAYNGFLISLRFLLTARRMNKKLRKLILSFMDNPIMKVIMFPIFYLRSVHGKGTQMSVLAIKKEFYD